MSACGFSFLGEPELATGFRYAGVPSEVVLTPDDALAAFRKVRENGTKVVVFSRNAADLIRDAVVQWQTLGSYPLVVEVPTLLGEGASPLSLLEMIRQAIGLPV